MTPLDEFLDDLFHSCALRAYVDIAEETGSPVPSSHLVKRRAYAYYEAEIKNQHSQISEAV